VKAGDIIGGVKQLEDQRLQYDALVKSDPEIVSDYLSRLIEAHELAGHVDQSIDVAQNMLDFEKRLYGSGDARSIDARWRLGQVLGVADRNEEAEKILVEARQLAQTTVGEENELSLNVAGDLAGVYESLKRYAEAEAIYNRLIEIRLRRDGADAEMTRIIQSNLAFLYDNTGRTELALARFREQYDIEKRIGGEAHPATLIVAHQIANSLVKLHRWKDALVWERRTLDLARKSLPVDHWHLGVMQMKYAEILGHLGQHEAALENFDEAILLLRKQLGDDHQQTRRAIELRAELLVPK
jgi:tetratricopeptide (TPR) repeat protein